MRQPAIVMAAMVMAAMMILMATRVAVAQQDPADLPGETGASSTAAAPAVVVIASPAPGSKVETFEQTPGAMIVKRFARIAVVASDDGGTINVYAVSLENTGSNSRQSGVAIELQQRGGRLARAYIDADELGPLLDVMENIEKLARPDGPLDGVEARFQTRGHFVLVNVDDGGSRAVVLHKLQIAPITGQATSATLRIRAGRLAEVRQQIAAARDALDRALAGTK